MERDPNLTAKGQRRCSGTKVDGQRCESFSLRDDELCSAHSMLHADRRREARAKGGHVSRRGLRGRHMQAVISRLYGSTEGVSQDFSGFPLIPDDEVRRPMAVLMMDPEHPTKVLFRDGKPWIHNPWDCVEHDFCLRDKALRLVGIIGNRRGDQLIPPALIEEFLATVVPGTANPPS